MQHEQMSALMDDELPEHESTTLLDQLIEDEDMKQTWGRYHMIGAVLRSPDPRSASISTPLTAPSTPPPAPHNVTQLPRRSEAGRLVAGMAIAASVAALAVTLSLRTPNPAPEAALKVADNVPVQTLQPQPVPVPVSAVTSAIPAGEVMTPIDDYNRRLDGYLVNFNEQRARLGVPGVHPYVRIVGFEPE